MLSIEPLRGPDRPGLDIPGAQVSNTLDRRARTGPDVVAWHRVVVVAVIDTSMRRVIQGIGLMGLVNGKT